MRATTLVISTVLGGSLMFGQMGPGGPGPGMSGHPGGPRGMGMHAGKLVAGAPYSATFTNTTVKTLADGNTIQRMTTGTVSRDSQGRTYEQETITGMFGQTGTKTMTFISDPVGGYVYSLNSETKTATRRALHTPGENPRAEGGRGGFGNTAKAAGTPRTSPNMVATELGSQLVNGVNATGKSMTHTIPAGQMGNEKPIVSTTETWFSPDLKVVISSKRTDPGEGTAVYALTNIARTEPEAALFTVPSDYTVKDAPAFGGRH